MRPVICARHALFYTSKSQSSTPGFAPPESLDPANDVGHHDRFADVVEWGVQLAVIELEGVMMQ
jgi:hypothetical protein